MPGLRPSEDARARAQRSSPAGCWGAVYSDTVMDDARLCSPVARDAAAHGAANSTPTTECLGARRRAGGRPPPGQRRRGDRSHRARRARGRRALLQRACGLNATAWADGVRRLLCARAQPGSPTRARLRPSRGIPLVYPAITRGHACSCSRGATAGCCRRALRRSHARRHHESRSRPLPGCATRSAPAREVRYLRAEVDARCRARGSQRPRDPVRGAAAGALRAQRWTAPRASHRLISDGPVLTLVGGKYTTFRAWPARRSSTRPGLGQRERPARRHRRAAPRPRSRLSGVAGRWPKFACARSSRAASKRGAPPHPAVARAGSRPGAPPGAIVPV